jgi:hypothetical protein
LGTRHRKKTRTPPKKKDTENIGHKTQKEDTNPAKNDRHGKHWTQDTKKTRTPPKKIDTVNFGHKTQKEDTDPTKKIDTENIGHKTQKDRHRYH